MKWEPTRTRTRKKMTADASPAVFRSMYIWSTHPSSVTAWKMDANAEMTLSYESAPKQGPTGQYTHASGAEQSASSTQSAVSATGASAPGTVHRKCILPAKRLTPTMLIRKRKRANRADTLPRSLSEPRRDSTMSLSDLTRFTMRRARSTRTARSTV